MRIIKIPTKFTFHQQINMHSPPSLPREFETTNVHADTHTREKAKPSSQVLELDVDIFLCSPASPFPKDMLNSIHQAQFVDKFSAAVVATFTARPHSQSMIELWFLRCGIEPFTWFFCEAIVPCCTLLDGLSVCMGFALLVVDPRGWRNALTRYSLTLCRFCRL